MIEHNLSAIIITNHYYARYYEQRSLVMNRRHPILVHYHYERFKITKERI